MYKTKLAVEGESFLINGRLTYSEIKDAPESVLGLLMNARFIQGVFDDKADPARFSRFGCDTFDPEKNTDDLINALPEWYEYGLRAFTVGFQGGGPCFTTDNATIQNNPFGENGDLIDEQYAARMDRLIRAADQLGMIVIVSFFYGAQAQRLKDGRAIRNAVKTASRFLKNGGYTNVIIEVANEHNIGAFKPHPILHSAEGMASLIDLARQESGGIPVGCSGGGGYINREVSEASDVILIHGNGQSRQQYFNMIHTIRSWDLNKPIVCNEDSQAIGQLQVAFHTRTSWGYYNNMTKQEPPADWNITSGEDRFFAQRMAEGLGINVPELSQNDQFYLQGLEPGIKQNKKRWIRLAALYPELIDLVDFHCNGEHVYSNYNEPFSVNYRCNWYQNGFETEPGDKWQAIVHLVDGSTLEINGETPAE